MARLNAGPTRSGFELNDEEAHPLRDGPQRALAYLIAAKRVAVVGLKSSVRYVAYSSDVGESLRPVGRMARSARGLRVAAAAGPGTCATKGK